MESLPLGIFEGMQHMSESVFVRMCQIVGTSQQVAIRREASDISEMVERQVTPNDAFIRMKSGSRREGFILKGSDMDFMFWYNNHRVIMEISQSEYYNTSNATLILSDSSDSPPGFTLLQLLTRFTYREVESALVPMNGRFYISSSKYRELTCSLIFPNSTVHGPCGTGVVGRTEYDTAFCFVCDFWPSYASPWIDRCRLWPDPEVVHDIVRNGCHFVAIGHPLGPNENKEWRISFSQAEYKLVSSMNHYQFLTYGLLKLFLKEVIDQQSEETNGLLCSYHMKTIVFWAFQQNTMLHWCPQNFLVGFWVCFKLLLKWVYEGICPNFFIPQNNLFLTKVHGSAQNELFTQLHEMYKKGLACLLQSSSIRSCIIDVLYNPRLSVHIDERLGFSEIDLDTTLFEDCTPFTIHPEDLTKAMHTIEQLLESPHYQTVTLQTFTASIFRSVAFITSNEYTNTGVNRQMYIAHKMSCHMLTIAAKFGCVSDGLYIAMYYYKTLRYREALYVIEMTKFKLARPYLMYMIHVDRERYTEAVGGQSWSTKMKKAVVMDIILNNKICYINELKQEQQYALQNSKFALRIPAFVMLHFLEFLCYRHIDTTLSQIALEDLQVLLHRDQDMYVPDLLRDISWEILGICQQITGNLQAALYYYQQSLNKEYPSHRIQTATQRRIQDIVGQTNNNN